MVMRSDAARVGAEKGIPLSFTSANRQPPMSSVRITTPNGVSVLKERYEDFETVLKSAARDIAVHPASVPRTIQNLGARLLDIHRQELAEVCTSMAKQYDSPHQQRWHEHRSRLRSQTLATRGVDVQKNRALIEHVYGADKSGLAAFRQAMEETGGGDHPAVHVFLGRVGAMLASKASPQSRLFGESPTLSKAQKPAYPAPVNPTPATSGGDVSSYSGRRSAPAGAPRRSMMSFAARLYNGGGS